MRKAFVFMVLAALILAVPARAQDKRVDVNIGGGYTFALSDVKDQLGNGYNFNLGVTIWATPMIGIQAEYSFNGLGEKQITIPTVPTPPGLPCPPTGCGDIATGPFFADMNMQYGNFNLVFRPHTEGTAHPYVVAGLGVYLSAREGDDAVGRLRAGVLRSVVVLLRAGRLGTGRRDRRLAQFDGLRDGFRRGRQRQAGRQRLVLRRGPVPLHLGSRGQGLDGQVCTARRRVSSSRSRSACASNLIHTRPGRAANGVRRRMPT